jgi:AcrR family transcriptional regulator
MRFYRPSSRIDAMSDTREKILEVAGRLFTERGFDKVSLREIADEVGVTKAALYYYFDSKDKLLGALAQPFFDMQDRFSAMLESNSTREAWAKGLEELVRWAIPHRAMFEFARANQTALEELMRRPEFEQKHAALHEKVDQTLNDERVPLEDRVRMVGATGLVWMGLALPTGRPAFGDANQDQLAEIVIDAIYDVLQLKR